MRKPKKLESVELQDLNAIHGGNGVMVNHVSLPVYKPGTQGVLVNHVPLAK